MNMNAKKDGAAEQGARYAAPAMIKHDPVKIVQGSGDYCSGYLYYTTLYYY